MRLLPLVVLAPLLVGCTADAPPSPDASVRPTATEPSATPSDDPPDAIRTEPLAPQAYTLTLADLPEPYATESARKGPNVVDVPADPVLFVPEGFRVNVFADGLDQPRWLALTPEGDVLVTETRENRIRRLRDTDGDGAADDRSTFADAANGLDIPFGMAFADGSFFLGNSAEVRRYAYAGGALDGRGERIAELPGGGYNQHWTRNVVASPDGEHLFVSIGSASNADPEPLPRASVQRMRLDGSEQTTFASGLRNPVGLAFHPQTGALYTTVNERDRLGDGLVPDYLTRIQQDEFYGWPYAYLTPDNLDPRLTDEGRSQRPDLAAQTVTPDVLFEAHSAALGLQFYDGTQFPERYRRGAFVAHRGSWNRSQGVGYKLVFVPFADGRPTGGYEDFLTGFLTDPSGPTTWGRPVGVLVLPDGSLLFTEEMNGRIYRVSFGE
ncbi:MAG: sorbosone dehydrogenase family protein [Rhodothermales bacterium]